MKELEKLVVTAFNKIKYPGAPRPRFSDFVFWSTDAVGCVEVMDGEKLCVSLFDVIGVYKLEATAPSPTRNLGDIVGVLLWGSVSMGCGVLSY